MSLRLFFTAGLLCIGSITCYTQRVGETYFLRHSLVFMIGEIPKVSSTNIVFTTQSICGFSELPYSGPILSRGEKVTIDAMNLRTDPATVSFKDSRMEVFTVELSNSVNYKFRKSFGLAFSKKSETFQDSNPKSEAALIKNYGFPIARCAENGKFFYIIEFSPICGSFDGCLVRVTSKGLDISGYI